MSKRRKPVLESRPTSSNIPIATESTDKQSSISSTVVSVHSDSEQKSCGSRSTQMEIGFHEEVKKVVKTLKDTKPKVKVSLREVYLLLAQHAQICDSSAADDRVAFVSDFLLRSKCGGNKLYDATHCSDDSIINQATKLNAEFPIMDALTIWELLETNDGNPVEVVRDRLIELSQHSSSVEVHPEASFYSPSDALISTAASPQGNKCVLDSFSPINMTTTIQYRLPVAPDPDIETNPSQDHLSTVSNTIRISHSGAGVHSSQFLAAKTVQNISKISSIPINQTPTISRIGQDHRFGYKTDSPLPKTKPLQSNDPGISSISLARRALLSTTPRRMSSFTTTNSTDAGQTSSDIKHSKTWSFTEVTNRPVHMTSSFLSMKNIQSINNPRMLNLRQQNNGQDIKQLRRTSSIPLATKTQELKNLDSSNSESKTRNSTASDIVLPDCMTAENQDINNTPDAHRTHTPQDSAYLKACLSIATKSSRTNTNQKQTNLAQLKSIQECAISRSSNLAMLTQTKLAKTSCTSSSAKISVPLGSKTSSYTMGTESNESLTETTEATKKSKFSRKSSFSLPLSNQSPKNLFAARSSQDKDVSAKFSIQGRSQTSKDNVISSLDIEEAQKSLNDVTNPDAPTQPVISTPKDSTSFKTPDLNSALKLTSDSIPDSFAPQISAVAGADNEVFTVSHLSGRMSVNNIPRTSPPTQEEPTTVTPKESAAQDTPTEQALLTIDTKRSTLSPTLSAGISKNCTTLSTSPPITLTEPSTSNTNPPLSSPVNSPKSRKDSASSNSEKSKVSNQRKAASPPKKVNALTDKDSVLVSTPKSDETLKDSANFQESIPVKDGNNSMMTAPTLVEVQSPKDRQTVTTLWPPNDSTTFASASLQESTATHEAGITVSSPMHVSAIASEDNITPRPSTCNSKILSTPNNSISVTKSTPSSSISLTKSTPSSSISLTKSTPSPNKSISMTKSTPKSMSVAKSTPNTSTSVTKSTPNNSISMTKATPNNSISVTKSTPNKSISVAKSTPNNTISVTKSTLNEDIGVTKSTLHEDIGVTKSTVNEDIGLTESTPNVIGVTESTPTDRDVTESTPNNISMSRSIIKDGISVAKCTPNDDTNVTNFSSIQDSDTESNLQGNITFPTSPQTTRRRRSENSVRFNTAKLASELTSPASVPSTSASPLTPSVSSRPSSPPNTAAQSKGDSHATLVLDASTIFSMFPDRDHNEIYSMVEAYRDKPDRVPIVIDELLSKAPTSSKLSANSSALPPDCLTVFPSHRSSRLLPSELTTPVLTGKSPQQLGDFLEEIDHLRDIFPDCDPNYLLQRLQVCFSPVNRVQVIAADMFERKKYPLLSDVLQSMAKEAENRHLMALDFTVEDFLAKFPDPQESFFACNKTMKANYIVHVTVQLYHDYPEFHKTYKDAVMRRNRFHLLHCIQELDAMKGKTKESAKHRCKRPKMFPLRYPDEPDERFFCELWYIRNQEKVHEHLAQKTKDRMEKLEKAKIEGRVFECSCCLDEELLIDDMKMCDDGHLFCHECICRSVKAGFGEGKTSFPCLSGHCSNPIPLTVLREVLPSSLLSKVLRKLQEEEVRQAGLPNLVECPFCSFATIMDDPDDKVFRCLNPDCLKDSCRLCREPNHVPLKCEEVESKNETNMRTFIEKKLNEAMIRKCHVCGRRFIKEVGCNKMTCVCGATSCYVCRTPNINYDHFQFNQCSESDMGLLHKTEMERTAREAKEEYLQLHPEQAETVLQYDPIKQVENMSTTMNFYGYRDFYNENDDDSSDDSIDNDDDDDEDDNDDFHHFFDFFE